MVTEIRDIRIKLDGLAKLTERLKPVGYTIPQIMLTQETVMHDMKFNSKEIEKSVDSLYLAKAWAGKLLQVLEVPTPYKNDGKRKTVEDIEPTADEDKGMNTLVGYNHLNFIFIWSKKSHVEKVDFIRQEIQKIDELVMTMNYDHVFNSTDYFFLCYNNVRTHLAKARFNLGFELSRYKEAHKNRRNEMKRFVLTVYDEGELEDVIEGLSAIDKFITPILKKPPMEAPLMNEDEDEMYLEDEEYD